MKLDVELTKADLIKLVLSHLDKLVDFSVKESDVIILTKSKQNYKAEWEPADFKAVLHINR